MTIMLWLCSAAAAGPSLLQPPEHVPATLLLKIPQAQCIVDVCGSALFLPVAQVMRVHCRPEFLRPYLEKHSCVHQSHPSSQWWQLAADSGAVTALRLRCAVLHLLKCQMTRAHAASCLCLLDQQCWCFRHSATEWPAKFASHTGLVGLVITRALCDAVGKPCAALHHCSHQACCCAGPNKAAPVRSGRRRSAMEVHAD